MVHICLSKSIGNLDKKKNSTADGPEREPDELLSAAANRPL